MMQCIASKEAPPAHLVTIACSETTQITKIMGCLEYNLACKGYVSHFENLLV
jgi:hypothetical protein